MDKGLTVPKWVLINWLKIPQMPQNLSAQKFGIIDEKKLHWASVVHCISLNYSALYLTAEYILYIHLLLTLFATSPGSDTLFAPMSLLKPASA